MKVLLILTGAHSFEWPVHRVKGGIEKVEIDQIRALQDLGLDFTVVATGDSTIEGIPHFKCRTLSRSGHGKAWFRMKQIREAVDAGLMDSHDVVLFNSYIPCSELKDGTLSLDFLEPYAHKLRLINHEPTDLIAGLRSVHGTLLGQAWVHANGGKVATVEPGGAEAWEDVEDKVRTGKVFRDLAADWAVVRDRIGGHQPRDFFEVMVVGDDFVALEDIEDGVTVNHVSRPATYKGVALSARAVTKLGIEDQFVGNVSKPTLPDAIKDWAKHEKWHHLFIEGEAHGDTMKSLARSRVFLQPTKSESAGGIVAFEAAAHGVPVITTTDTSKRYLEPYGLYHRVDRDVPSIVIALEATLTSHDRMEKESTARRVREDFGRDAYAEGLCRLLSVDS